MGAVVADGLASCRTRSSKGRVRLLEKELTRYRDQKRLCQGRHLPHIHVEVFCRLIPYARYDELCLFKEEIITVQDIFCFM